MLQCHFLSSVLSKHFVVYESVRTTHLDMAFLDVLIIALITGGVSSLGTIAALKRTSTGLNECSKTKSNVYENWRIPMVKKGYK
ncbi:hypothetical protein [Vibrio splendidus]|uniref:hypothetical protein n=1 Tax=Vibrio splendidus TaxID=29497 RepID=UPI0015E7CBFC|nr:hypothetical protein [Vibrio splendidus]